MKIFDNSSKLAVRSALVSYAAALAGIATALGLALALKHYNLPHPFMSFSLAVIAITFWYACSGPGLVALLLACLALSYFFVPMGSAHHGSESFLIIYIIFGLLVIWFSASRRRAEHLLRDARDHLEVRVQARTRDLSLANVSLQDTQSELRSEKNRLKLLLDLTNNIGCNFELHDVLKAGIAGIRHVLGSDVAGVGVSDTDNGQLLLFILDSENENNIREHELPLAGESMPVQVFHHAEPWLGRIQDLQSGQSGRDHFVFAGLKVVCIRPLITCMRLTSADSALGILIVGRRADLPYTAEDLSFLEQVSTQIAIAVEKAMAVRRISELTEKLAQEKLYLEDELRSDSNFTDIIGTSAGLRHVLKLVETVAPTDSTVLIYGETGTGKELIARAIHTLSLRRARTFVRLNCAAIPTGLIESELFGHEKGAFTGAVAQRLGRLEVANQGTLFLDEIGEIPLEVQPKLLRVLQEREFERLGSTRAQRSDVRLIAATNRNLEAMVQEHRFRSDLFYRLNVFPIYLPALRERPEDIPLLVRHFAQDFSRRMNKNIETIGAGVMKALCEYSWPGNIRELQNVIERAVILSSGTALRVPIAELGVNVSASSELEKPVARPSRRIPVRSIVAEVNREEILKAIAESGGRLGGRYGAAAHLGLKRTTLITRMKKLDIDRNEVSERESLTADTSDTSSPPSQEMQ